MVFKACLYFTLSFVGSIYALTINTPASVVECQPLALSWSNGSAPYYLAVIPGGDTSTTLENLPTQSSGSSYTWTCDIASGTTIGFRVTDSTGLIAYTDSITVQAGSDSSCVGNSSSTASGANATASSNASISGTVMSSSAAGSSSASSKASTTRSSTESSSAGTDSAAGSSATTPSASGGAMSAFSAARSMTGVVCIAFLVTFLV